MGQVDRKEGCITKGVKFTRVERKALETLRGVRSAFARAGGYCALGVEVRSAVMCGVVVFGVGGVGVGVMGVGSLGVAWGNECATLNMRDGGGASGFENAAIAGGAWVLAGRGVWENEDRQPQGDGGAALGEGGLEEAIVILHNGAAPDAARARAAILLLAAADTQERARVALVRELDGPLAGAGGGRFVVAAMLADGDVGDDGDEGTEGEEDGGVPRSLEVEVVGRLKRAAAEEVGVLMRVVSRYQSRYAVRALLAWTGGDADAETAQEAFKALTAQTGAGHLGTDHGAWAAWLDSFEGGSEAEWQREVLVNVSRQARRHEGASAAVTARLVEASRKLYLATASADRPGLLVDLLTDKSGALQDLGFELAEREISNNAALDGRVGSVALALLGDSSPKVRSGAAVLLRQLSPGGAAEAIVAALDRETDPQAASDLLLAATRVPTPDAIDAVMRWLERESDAREAAVEACLRISRVVALPEASQEVILRLLRPWVGGVAGAGFKERGPTAAGVALLAEIGNSDDLAMIARLLESEESSVRSAAAAALVWDEEYRAVLLSAAERHPELSVAAARAVLVHTPDAGLFARAMALVAPAAGGGADPMLVTVVLAGARQLSGDQLLEAWRACSGCGLSGEVLASLTSAERVMMEGGRKESMEAIRRGALLLAGRHLKQNDAAAALVTLDGAVYLDEDEGTRVEAEGLRLIALMGVGKLATARAICAGSSDPGMPRVATLMAGLEMARGTSHLSEAAELIFDVAKSRLEEAQRERIAMLLGEVALAGPPAPGGGNGGLGRGLGGPGGP